MTYSNNCTASCSGATVAYTGECGKEAPEVQEQGGGDGEGGFVCRCTRELRWVCGADGVTYTNPCMAICNGTTVAYEGHCADPCEFGRGGGVYRSRVLNSSVCS